MQPGLDESIRESLVRAGIHLRMCASQQIVVLRLSQRSGISQVAGRFDAAHERLETTAGILLDCPYHYKAHGRQIAQTLRQIDERLGSLERLQIGDPDLRQRSGFVDGRGCGRMKVWYQRVRAAMVVSSQQLGLGLRLHDDARGTPDAELGGPLLQPRAQNISSPV